MVEVYLVHMTENSGHVDVYYVNKSMEEFMKDPFVTAIARAQDQNNSSFNIYMKAVENQFDQNFHLIDRDLAFCDVRNVAAFANIFISDGFIERLAREATVNPAYAEYLISTRKEAIDTISKTDEKAADAMVEFINRVLHMCHNYAEEALDMVDTVVHQDQDAPIEQPAEAVPAEESAVTPEILPAEDTAE